MGKNVWLKRRRKREVKKIVGNAISEHIIKIIKNKDIPVDIAWKTIAFLHQIRNKNG